MKRLIRKQLIIKTVFLYSVMSSLQMGAPPVPVNIEEIFESNTDLIILTWT